MHANTSFNSNKIPIQLSLEIQRKMECILSVSDNL